MKAAAEARAGAPILRADPFTREFMDDPYPHFEAMREAGPAL